jgi:S1-C subfamily serine protease
MLLLFSFSSISKIILVLFEIITSTSLSTLVTSFTPTYRQQVRLSFLPHSLPKQRFLSTSTCTCINTSSSSSLFVSSSSRVPVSNTNNSTVISKPDTILTTKSSILDQNLTSNEQSVVNVVRLYGPSVAYVTSYSIPMQYRNENQSQSKRQKLPPPRSTPLGSGSAFAISSNDGYFITNYHVIERAYKIQYNQKMIQDFMTNITNYFPFPKTKMDPNLSARNTRLQNNAQVYLRLGQSSSLSSKQNDLIPARIVSVKPELDTAILQLEQPILLNSNNSNNRNNTVSNIQESSTSPQPIPYGSSSTLLVGQTVLAIGNPFGLDQTITTGVVSALNRPIKSTINNNQNTINCIQTDAAINPGNSGGPLLNSNGECIGMNTMIISTSGSNAGIGFAIGIDEIREYVENEIELDRLKERSRSSSSRMNLKRMVGY